MPRAEPHAWWCVMRTFLIKMNICKPSVNPVLHILGDIFKIVGDVCNNLGEVCKNLIDFIKLVNLQGILQLPVAFLMWRGVFLYVQT